MRLHYRDSSGRGHSPCTCWICDQFVSILCQLVLEKTEINGMASALTSIRRTLGEVLNFCTPLNRTGHQRIMSQGRRMRVCRKATPGNNYCLRIQCTKYAGCAKLVKNPPPKNTAPLTQSGSLACETSVQFSLHMCSFEEFATRLPDPIESVCNRI